MPKITHGEQELAEFMRRNRMINEDERFKEAMLVAHPDIRVGIHTDPCTDNPQFMAPVVTIRSGGGFDYGDIALHVPKWYNRRERAEQ